MARDDLKELYGVIAEKHGKSDHGKRRDITSSTADLLSKSHPKSPLVLDYEAELFGLSPDEIKRLPIKSVEMLLQALQHLISKTKEDPMLRQALRKMIMTKFNTADDEEEEPVGEGDWEPEEDAMMPEGKRSEATILEAYKHFLMQLSESKATKFNYKVLLDIEPTKINNPIFNQLLQTFQLTELTRPQKQGTLLLLKKLAEIAEGNPAIGQALNRIVRLESTQEAPAADGGFNESLTEDQENLMLESMFDVAMTPQTILADLGINKFKADEFASSLLGYADWADVTKLQPEKLAGVIKSAIKNAGGLQKFIELLLKTKISNSRSEKLAKLFAD